MTLPHVLTHAHLHTHTHTHTRTHRHTHTHTHIHTIIASFKRNTVIFFFFVIFNVMFPRVTFIIPLCRPFICLTWLILICDMTHSSVRHDSFIYVTDPCHRILCTTWLLHMFGTWLIFMCRVTLSYVLQCVAVCCSVLQCVAVCCSVLQCVAVCCHVDWFACVA